MTKFIADIEACAGPVLPQSQIVTRDVAWLPFDRTNRGFSGTILVPYIGGTIGAKEDTRGLKPQVFGGFEDFLEANEVNPDQVHKMYPNTEFIWTEIPPPLDSGTMDELERVYTVMQIGLQTEKVLSANKNLIGILPVHGTDSSPISLSQIAETYPCSPIPINLLTAQNIPGTWRGDSPKNIKDGIEFIHTGIAGHFVNAADKVYTPFDAGKVTDHGHAIYGEGPYGFGLFGDMDATRITIEKGVVRLASNDPLFMPWNNSNFMRHYQNVDTPSKSYEDEEHGTCLVIPAGSLRDVVHDATRKVANDNSVYKYALVGALGTSNVDDARQEFLKVASKTGVCSIVVSNVPGAADSSPYAAGAESSQHVLVVSPDTDPEHTQGKFFVTAALTEHVLEIYGVSGDDADKIRPLLFQELYRRERGYDAAFIPGGGNKGAAIKDHALQRLLRSKAPKPQAA